MCLPQYDRYVLVEPLALIPGRKKWLVYIFRKAWFVSLRTLIVASDQASASRPFLSTRLSSLSEGPFGFFWPCSHFCIVDGLVFR